MLARSGETLAPVIGTVFRIFPELIPEIARICKADCPAHVSQRHFGTQQQQYGGVPDSEQAPQRAVFNIQMKAQIISDFTLRNAQGFGEVLDTVIGIAVITVLNPSEDSVSDDDFYPQWKDVLGVRFTMEQFHKLNMISGGYYCVTIDCHLEGQEADQ